jgi:hypothetical protein
MRCTSRRTREEATKLRIMNCGGRISILLLLLVGISEGAIATFDDLPLAPESHWNGADGAGGFISGQVQFITDYNADWDCWDGFAYSNGTDPNAVGLEAQYNAIAGGGQGGSPNYGVVFVGWESLPTLTLDTPQVLGGLYVTNDSYAYYDMLYGGFLSKKFGGPTGNDPDWFKLTITGLDATGRETGRIDFYLADYRCTDHTKDYLLKSWAYVDLTPLGEVKTLQFNLDSSDKTGPYLNTPSYVCIDTIRPQTPIATFDDLPLAPEARWNGADGAGGFISGQVQFINNYNPDWDGWDGFAYSNRTDPNMVGLDAQYNAIAGGGQGGSANYGVVFVGWESLPTLTLVTPQVLGGLYVTNDSYAYYDMLHGSAFSKKFGGAKGDDPDWFKLSITGLDASGHETGRVEFYLADYRFTDNTKDYLLKSWAFVDLSSLGEVKALQFNLDSSDKTGPYLNTPSYVCVDTIVPRESSSGK